MTATAAPAETLERLGLLLDRALRSRERTDDPMSTGTDAILDVRSEPPARRHEL